MSQDSSFMLLFWIQFGLFILPTVAALIWAWSHHWDLPEEMEHPS